MAAATDVPEPVTAVSSMGLLWKRYSPTTGQAGLECFVMG